jgi:tetratricopeptide (TPR) repeat protein
MVHHHCAGLAYLNRSKAERTDSVKRFRLVQAVDEHGQALRACPASNPFSANITTNLAMVYVEQGKTTEALQSLDQTIAAHPTYDGAYIAKSILLKRSGKADASRNVLLQGAEATGDGSAELHYALGLSYANTKEYEKAVEHARRAYELGYPLPGLRNKLERAGYKL